MNDTTALLRKLYAFGLKTQDNYHDTNVSGGELRLRCLVAQESILGQEKNALKFVLTGLSYESDLLQDQIDQTKGTEKKRLQRELNQVQGLIEDVTKQIESVEHTLNEIFNELSGPDAIVMNERLDFRPELTDEIEYVQTDMFEYLNKLTD